MGITIEATRHWKAGRVFKNPPAVGKHVHHYIFGVGTVEKSQEKARRGDCYVRVNFEVHGVKELLWSFCAGKLSKPVARK